MLKELIEMAKKAVKAEVDEMEVVAEVPSDVTQKPVRDEDFYKKHTGAREDVIYE